MKMKNLVSAMGLALCAFTLPFASFGETGDIYEIRPVSGSGASPADSLKPGQTLQFKVRLLTRDFDVPSPSQWVMTHVGIGSEAWDAVYNPLQIGIVVSGRTMFARIVSYLPFANGYTDVTCEYQVEPGDIAFPVRLALKGSTPENPIIAGESDTDTEYCLKNAEYWAFKNAAGDVCKFTYCSITRANQAGGMCPTGESGRDTDYDLTIYGKFYVQGVRFSEQWESTEVWRTVHEGTTTTSLMPTIETIGVPTNAVTLYVWSKDETSIKIPASKGTWTMVKPATTDPVSPAEYRWVRKIEVLTGISSYTFEIEGVTKDTETELVLSPTDHYVYNGAGTLCEDFLTVPVACDEAPPPYVTVTVDGGRSIQVQPPIGDAYNTRVATVQVKLSQACDHDVTVTLKPSLPSKPAKAWSDYIGLSEYTDGGAHDGTVSVLFKAKEMADGMLTKSLQLYALGSDADTIGPDPTKAIRLEAEVDAASQSFFTGVFEYATVFLMRTNPVITQPKFGEEFPDIQGGTTYGFELKVEDTYKNAATPDAAPGYVIYVKTGSTGSAEKKIACPDTVDGTWHLAADGTLKENGGRLPVAYDTAGSYKTEIRLVAPDGQKSWYTGGVAEGPVKVNVTVSKPATVEAVVSKTKWNEGDLMPVDFRISQTHGETIYAFLKPDNDATVGLVKGDCVILGGAADEGVEIMQGDMESVGSAVVRLLDGRSEELGGTSLAFTIVLWKKSSYVESETEYAVEGFQPKRLSIKVNNVVPKVTGVERVGGGTASWTSSADEPVLNVSVSKGVVQKFTLTNMSKNEPGLLDLPTMKMKWKFSEYNEEGKFVLGGEETLEGTPALKPWEHTFKTAGYTLVTVQLMDKDMAEYPGEFGDEYTFRVDVSGDPSVTVAENGFTFNEADSSGKITVRLSQMANDPIQVKAVVTPYESSADPGRFVLDQTKRFPGGAENEYLLTFEPGTATAMENILTFSDLDGTLGSQQKGFRIALTVLTTTLDPDGRPYNEVYHAEDGRIFVMNEKPMVIAPATNGPVDEKNLGYVAQIGANESRAITFTIASDVAADIAAGFKVTFICTGGSGMLDGSAYTGPVKITDLGSHTFVPNFTSQGAQQITLRIEDKDTNAGTEVFECTWFYDVQAAKTLRLVPHGPTAGFTTSALSQRYADLAAEGHVWANVANPTMKGFNLSYNCGTSKSVDIYAFGYKVASPTDNGTLNGGRDVAIDQSGNASATGPFYTYSEANNRDSFFYRWILIGGGSDEGAGEGESGGMGGLAPERAGTTVAQGKVDLPSELGEEGAYEETIVEAVFSYEWLWSDNVGDMNQDGIPDVFLTKKWEGSFGELVDPATGEVSGNDLTKLNGFNDDGDILPSMDTSKYGTFIPDLAGTWVTYGSSFDARLEVRGYHEGLNDALSNAAFPTYVNVKSDRVYEVDGAWDEKKCTISYVEYLAWKDSGLPVAEWSPERPSDPTVDDTDKDGMPDGYEYFFWYRAHVGWLEADGTHKYLVGRRWNPKDPQHPDLIPPSEIEKIMDPVIAGDKSSINTRDTDNDGLPDLLEFERGTNPFDYDTDGDGLPDGYEVLISETNPLDASSGDGLLNPDGDQMAFVLQDKWHLVGVLNAAGGIDYYVAPELSADGVTNEFTAVESEVTNTYTLVSALNDAGETVKYVTTATPQAYTNADGVARLVKGLSADETWLLTKVGEQNVRGRATLLVKGATLTAEPEPIDCVVLKVDAKPSTYYKAWFYEQEKINNQLVDVFIRGAELGARTSADPLAAEGLEVVDVRDYAYVGLIHFYAYQDAGFDARTAWKDPGVAIPQSGSTRRFAHRDELYLLTFLYHANLLSDANLRPTTQRPWLWIWRQYATNPLSCDTDSDGAPDGWELYVFAGPKIYRNGKLVIGYDWTQFPGRAFSPVYPYNGEPNVDDFRADGDGHSEIQEFSAVESVAAYVNKPGAEAIAFFDPEWTNKRWPTDPWNADTDGDGLTDPEEQRAFRHNGALNPCSWDTDRDGLPDPWEVEFAGTAKIGGSETNAVAGADASNAAAAKTWVWNDDGMDGTVNDAMKDYDHDGLRNWQEYMVGAMRCWRYDDVTSPWTANVGDVPDPDDGEKWYNVLLNPESPDFNPGLSDFILDPGVYFSCATNAYEQSGVFGKFYMLKDGHYHDLKIDAANKAKGYRNRWVRNLENAGLAAMMEKAYPTKYICCDPRRHDTDADGMDDYYELFHGLNPLLGPEVDVVARAWGYPKFPLCATVNNWYAGIPAVPTRPDKEWRTKGLNDRDFFQLPWLAGLPDADPDGDNIRNQQEAIFANVQAASTYLHIDPTPLWMTDSQYEDSLTYRYYHISTPSWGTQAKVWMPPEPYFEYNGQRYYWADFPWIHYNTLTGVCEMRYSINNWNVMDYMFSFEENEGYDSDHDYLSDYEEGQGKTKNASDPQVSDSPLRRQAMWFGGEDDKGFLETPLPLDEIPPTAANAEKGQALLYYTVECWAKADETTYAKAGLQTLVERAIMTGPGNVGDESWLRKNFVLGIRDGRWYTRFDSTGTDKNQPVEIAGGPAATTNWTHVAATYDGTALRLYVNGVCTSATTQYTSIQPEHGVNAIAVNDASEFTDTYNVPFVGDRGLAVPQIAMLVGASALDSLAVVFDYQWQTRNVAMFGLPRGINTMAQTTMDSYGNFFRGYIDEVRVWDGARKGADILADYKQRVRYDSAKAQENRETVYKSWAKGGARSDHAVEQLPPQLMYHWSFDHIAGAVDRADVMRVPAGFDTAESVIDSMAIWTRPVGWTSFWLDEGVNSALWDGQVFSDHAWQPWVTDTISHLPRFDGTVLDSVYWSENFTGARTVESLGYAKLQFPRNAEVSSRWTQMLYASGSEVWAEDSRWDVIKATGDEELMQKYVFARRNLVTVGADLMIFGSAYPKRISAAEGGMWDDQGPADAWSQTGSDADHNSLPDWWEEYARENYGVDPFTPIGWTTSVTYEGRTMPAWEAYLRDVSRGLTMVGGVAKVRGEYADDRDLDGDGIPDWWEDIYHVNTHSPADTLADPDGDGLGNFAEYIISEVFGYARLDPNDPKSDGVCVDYFRKVGDLYLGEIFTDHDQVDDAWENNYAGYADFYAYDPSRDDDGDGWSNWAEQKAGTDPRLVKEAGIDDYTLVGFPVPCIRARIVNNGPSVETAPVVIKAWSESRDPDMTGDPDATWTISGSTTAAEGGEQQMSDASGEKKEGTEMGESSKYLGIKPEGTRTLTLGPGAIERNSVKIFYKDLSFCKAKLIGDVIVPIAIGNETEVQWYYLVHDREGKLYTTGGIFADEQEVGTVDYDTGKVTIDFSNEALCGILLGNPGETVAEGETPTYDLLNLDQSYVLVTWNSSATAGSLNRTLYLSDADDPGDISGRFDHVREGLNTFIAFVDRDGDGAYSAGEPYGFVRGVDVGWSGAEFEIELTETSPVFARANVFGGGNSGGNGGGDSGSGAVSDRQAIWGTSCGDTLGLSTGSNDTWGVSANAYEHVRIVPYMVAGVLTDGDGTNSFVYAVDYVESRVVAEFDVRRDTKPYITEADFIRDGAFDIDWDGFSTAAFANNSLLTSAIGEVTAVKYRVIFGNEGPIGPDSNLDFGKPGISSFQTLIERRFERTAARTKPTGLSVDGVVSGAQPLFGWRLDEPTDVQGSTESAARYGCSYTAFEIQVADAGGNVVYDSGVVRAPARDKDGCFRWKPTALYAGDQTALGKVFSAVGNWKWRVAMYNSKFKPNVRETMNGWSAWQAFSTSVGTGNTLADLAHATIDVSVKYTGPVKTLDGCEDLSKAAGTVRIQAFVSPDFSGEPVAQGFIADKAALTDVADTAANGRLVGLTPGDYYLRAYIDTNGNFKKDAWESWGTAAEPVTVVPNTKIPVVSFFIEDADTDQDWIPDAWEMQVNGSLDVDNVQVLSDGQIKFKLIYPETKAKVKSAAAPVMFFQNLNAARMLLTSEATASGGDAVTDILAAAQPRAVPGTVAITSLALDANKGEAVLTVTGETAKSAAAELLDAIYVFPDQPLTLGVYRKNSLLEKDWTWVKDVPVTLGTGAEAKVTVQLGDDVDMTQGFYMVEIKQ